MRISQLAASTGIPISTIRYYDYQHLIPESYMHKLPNGQRDFTAAAIPFLTKIHTIIHAGVQINELKTLLIERPHASSHRSTSGGGQASHR
ncbi:MerR family transcriptional regulator [Lacticaseibacillus saniviri]|uniref:MerR family transcriptional regulator n=1 Tax=Lacticaseibacillus saniviri TaxID=931533 RepID=UPI0006D0AB5B|nr:MerR family transcriptional regulator [Lacticaseibacillus saniviri]